jgi:hypothetical protein
MIYVNNLNNQLNVIYDTRKDVYAFESIKSVGFSWDTNGDYYVTINFIANDKNNSLRIYLKDVDPVNVWTNTFAGATYAVTVISQWMDHVIEVDAQIAGPLGFRPMAESVSVVIANDQEGISRTPGMLRPTGSGDVSTAAATFFSVSVANVGAANGTVLDSVTIKPGEVLNFSADAINNYFTSFAYDATGTEFIIIYVA